MASVDYSPPKAKGSKGKARFFFRYPAQQQHNAVRPVQDRAEAERWLSIIEETISDLKRGKLILPADADVPTVKLFILSAGKVATKPESVSQPGRSETEKHATIASIFETYSLTLTVGSKEANSIDTEAVHGRHFVRVIGADRRFDTLGVDVIQKYVDDRAKEGVVRETIRKELTTLRVLWGWAFQRKHIALPLAWRIKDITLPKASEKQPFQTLDQIVRQIQRGKLTAKHQSVLWESLWLDQAQTVECLAWVRENATEPVTHPMMATAAYTGARRGEILRSDRDDWDLEGLTVTLRQKKADRSKDFTRRAVSIHPALAAIMTDWFASHPGERLAFSTEEGDRINERLATRYFRRALAGGKWKILHGYHVFRHSLASNLASAGADPRQINEILGHHTEEMERRYRHLCPKKQASAINGLFLAAEVK
jgi:integrase